MRALPPAQRKALLNARTHGNATWGLRGQSEWGGWEATRRVLRRERWIDPGANITELGRWRLAIELGEIPKDTPPPAVAPLTELNR